jgi:multiple sugar transport system ATP-binding protein
MVFQSYALYPHMTVEKNLSFGPSVRRESKEETAKRIKDVASVLGIDHLLRRRPSELSGGQRQRVALGRSMIRQPQLFLLDEPLSNLDAALRVQMRTELLRLHTLLPVTTVYVTHDQVEALTMGDRVAVFNRGDLLQIGTPQELYNRPRTVFVAEFIGSPKMHMVDGVAASVQRDSLTIRALDQTITVPASQAPTVTAGTELKVGIRPQDLRWVEERPARCTFTFPISVEVVEHTGAEMFVTGVGAQEQRVMGCVHRSAAVEVGATAEFALDPADLHIFDSASGERIALTPQEVTESDHTTAVSESGTANVATQI